MAVALRPTRAPQPSSLADVLDVVLDKGIVIDAYVRVSLVGIELITIDARIVVASVDTYLRFAEAVNRLELGGSESTESRGLPEAMGKMTEGGAEGKTKGALKGAAESVKGWLGGSDGGQDGQQSGNQSRGSERGTRSLGAHDGESMADQGDEADQAEADEAGPARESVERRPLRSSARSRPEGGRGHSRDRRQPAERRAPGGRRVPAGRAGSR
jgi:gas vesicle structural protein